MKLLDEKVSTSLQMLNNGIFQKLDTISTNLRAVGRMQRQLEITQTQ